MNGNHYNVEDMRKEFERGKKQGVLDYRKSIIEKLKEMESKGKTIIEVKELVNVLKELEKGDLR